MTKGMERIINELKGENKTTVIERLYSENETAKETQKLRLASDLNNLIFYLNNPQAAKKISNAGKIKITKILKPSNDMLVKKIISTVFKK